MHTKLCPPYRDITAFLYTLILQIDGVRNTTAFHTFLLERGALFGFYDFILELLYKRASPNRFSHYWHYLAAWGMGVKKKLLSCKNSTLIKTALENH